MIKKLIIILVSLFCIAVGTSRAQYFSVSTNVGDWALLGTINGSVQYGFSQHFSVEGQARYNNWTFNKGQENQFEWRQKTFALGARWWPWHVYSGWFLGAKAQYQEYNQGGMLWVRKAEEGDAFGIAITAGYSMQINKWLNIDFGVGGWGGYKKYTAYSCPFCGVIESQGGKAFFAPNEIIIAAMFLF